MKYRRYFHPVLWGIVAFSSILVSYLVNSLPKSSNLQFLFYFIIAMICGALVFLTGIFATPNESIFYKLLLKHNIELVVGLPFVSKSIPRKDDEIVFAEFLLYNKKDQELISFIRSSEFEKKHEWLGEWKKFSFSHDLSKPKGFAWATLSKAKEFLEENKIKNINEWKELMFSAHPNFPILYSLSKVVPEHFYLDQNEIDFMINFLNIKSVLSCPIITFKRHWLKKRAKIFGILNYASNFEYPGHPKSSLPNYRSMMVKTVFTIAVLRDSLKDISKKEAKKLKLE